MALSKDLDGFPQKFLCCHNFNHEVLLASWLGIYVVMVNSCVHMHLVKLSSSQKAYKEALHSLTASKCLTVDVGKYLICGEAVAKK